MSVLKLVVQVLKNAERLYKWTSVYDSNSKWLLLLECPQMTSYNMLAIIHLLCYIYKFLTLIEYGSN